MEARAFVTVLTRVTEIRAAQGMTNAILVYSGQAIAAAPPVGSGPHTGEHRILLLAVSGQKCPPVHTGGQGATGDGGVGVGVGAGEGGCGTGIGALGDVAAGT